MVLERLKSGSSVMSLPSSTMVPVSGRKLPAMALNSVDLPAPLEPTMVAKSPASRCRFTFWSATFSLTVPGLKVLPTFFSSSMALAPFHGAGAAAFEIVICLDGGRGDGQRHNAGGDEFEAL